MQSNEILFSPCGGVPAGRHTPCAFRRRFAAFLSALRRCHVADATSFAASQKIKIYILSIQQHALRAILYKRQSREPCVKCRLYGELTAGRKAVFAVFQKGKTKFACGNALASHCKRTWPTFFSCSFGLSCFCVRTFCRTFFVFVRRPYCLVTPSAKHSQERSSYAKNNPPHHTQSAPVSHTLLQRLLDLRLWRTAQSENVNACRSVYRLAYGDKVFQNSR